MHHESIAAWASKIGSRAKTKRGQLAAIKRHIAALPQRDPICAPASANKRRIIPCTQWLPELGALGISAITAQRKSWEIWYRIARCLRHGRYRVIYQHSIPSSSTFFLMRTPKIDAIYVFPGRLHPHVFKNGYYMRWMQPWSADPDSHIAIRWVACCGEDNLAAYLNAPGRLGRPGILHECARYDRAAKLYRLWRWSGSQWVPSGVAVPMPDDLRIAGYGNYVRGLTADDCRDTITAMRQAHIAQVARQAQIPRLIAHRHLRAARLLARIGRNITVSADDLRAVGACRDGIEAWCRAHHISPQSRMPLAELFRMSKQSAYWAVQAARRIFLLKNTLE